MTAPRRRWFNASRYGFAVMTFIVVKYALDPSNFSITDTALFCGIWLALWLGLPAADARFSTWSERRLRRLYGPFDDPPK